MCMAWSVHCTPHERTATSCRRRLAPCVPRPGARARGHREPARARAVPRPALPGYTCARGHAGSVEGAITNLSVIALDRMSGPDRHMTTTASMFTGTKILFGAAYRVHAVSLKHAKAAKSAMRRIAVRQSGRASPACGCGTCSCTDRSQLARGTAGAPGGVDLQAAAVGGCHSESWPVAGIQRQPPDI